jgi:hypothetical protein
MERAQLQFCRTCIMSFMAIPETNGYMHKNCCSLCTHTRGTRHTERCMNLNMGPRRYNELQREIRRIEENRRNINQQWSEQEWQQWNREAHGWVQHGPVNQAPQEQGGALNPVEENQEEQAQAQEEQEEDLYDEFGNMYRLIR